MTTPVLRFASLIRVSSERQEKKGESLTVQRKSNEDSVASFGGTIVASYGGQESAMSGKEHKEVERLLADAAKKKFNAVIVAHSDRWSRDNAKSKEGLEILRRNGVRFFVSRMEMDLFNPMHSLILGMSAEIGEFFVLQQTLKSMESRIELATQGCAACKPWPIGRLYDKEKKTWSVDVEIQRKIHAAAVRYLAGKKGDGLEHLARITKIKNRKGKEEPMSLTCLWNTLRHNAGGVWVQRFECKRLNIKAEVATPVPPLLPPDMIQAIQIRAERNRSGKKSHDHLLSGYVYCAGCKRRMAGEYHKRHKKAFYMHVHAVRQKEPCPCRCALVDAEVLEKGVLWDLFECFGNAPAVERALKRAAPTTDKADEYRARLDDIHKRLQGIDGNRQTILNLIARGALTEDDAYQRLMKLKTSETALTEERALIHQEMEGMLTPEQIKNIAHGFSTAFGKVNRAKQWAMEFKANSDFDGMTYDDKRRLVEMVFAGAMGGDLKGGVYVSPPEGLKGNRRWSYRILGRLIDISRLTPDIDLQFDADEVQPTGLMQRVLLEGCTDFRG